MNDQLDGWMDGWIEAGTLRLSRTPHPCPCPKKEGDLFFLAKEPKERTGPTYLPTYIGDGHVHVIGRRFEFNVD